MGALTLATLRLPVAFTAVIALVVLALVLLIFGTLNTHTTLTKTAGWVTFVFAALGLYLFLSAASVADGRQGVPAGPADRPLTAPVMSPAAAIRRHRSP